jgi:hypothetical protein
MYKSWNFCSGWWGHKLKLTAYGGTFLIGVGGLRITAPLT